MTHSLFPPYVRSFDDSVACLDDWVDTIGGARLDGRETEEGHEASHGGRCHLHLHLRPGQNKRVAHRPVTLADPARRIHDTLR